MSTDMTMQDAIAAVKDSSGPEALMSLRHQIEATLRAKAGQLASIQAEMNALRQVCKLIDTLTSESDVLTGSANQQAALGAPPPVKSQIGQERIERLAKGKCTFRDQKTKKWCRCKLSNAAEKQHGYCAKHLNHLGILKGKKADAEE